MAASGPTTAASGVARGLPFKADSSPLDGAPIVALLFVLALALAARWALKRSGWRRAPPPGAGTRLQVQETVWVSPRVRVSHVRCGDQEFLLAHSDHGQSWVALSGAATSSSSLQARPDAAPPTAHDA